jgi:ribosomal-protein-alanine N-acetyltransferase
MGVAPDARGTGLGTTLVQAYLEEGRAEGYRRFRLDVSAANRGAIRLYERAGFRVERESSAAQGVLRYLSMTIAAR